MPAIAAPAATWTGGPTSRDSIQPRPFDSAPERSPCHPRPGARHRLAVAAWLVLAATLAGCANGGGASAADISGDSVIDPTALTADGRALGLDGPTRPRDASAADLASQLGAGFDALGSTGGGSGADEPDSGVAAAVEPRTIARGDLTVEPIAGARSSESDPDVAPAAADTALAASGSPADGTELDAPHPMRAAMRDGLAGSLGELRRLAVVEAGRDAHPLRWLLMVATTALIEPDLPFDPAGFADLTEAEQQVLASAHAHFAELGRQLADGDGSDSVLPELERLVTALRGEESFRLDRLTLCSSVRNFGDFTPLEPPMFFTGRESAFVWYGELHGFTSTRDEERDAWRTELETRMTIYDRASGIPVRTGSPELVRDLASAKRSDFFLNQLVRLPGNLPVGVYTLKIAVKDLGSGAFAEATADFAMVIDEAIDPAEIARIVQQYGD